jgi:hypothetical protein
MASNWGSFTRKRVQEENRRRRERDADAWDLFVRKFRRGEILSMADVERFVREHP